MKPESQEVEEVDTLLPDRVWLADSVSFWYPDCEPGLHDVEYIRASQVADQLEQTRREVWERAIKIVIREKDAFVDRVDGAESVGQAALSAMYLIRDELESARTNEVSK